jgi:hypothetical protein
LVRGHPRVGRQVLQPAEDVVGLDVIIGHDEGLQIAGEFLTPLWDAEGIQDEVHEGLQVSHPFVLRDELQPGAAEVSPTHILDARLEAYRTTHLDPARRLQHVEVAADDTISEFAHS